MVRGSGAKKIIVVHLCGRERETVKQRKRPGAERITEAVSVIIDVYYVQCECVSVCVGLQCPHLLSLSLSISVS